MHLLLYLGAGGFHISVVERKASPARLPWRVHAVVRFLLLGGGMSQQLLNTLQDECVICVFQRFSSLIRKQVSLPALLCFVFLPILIESAAFPSGQKVPEFKPSEFVVGHPLAIHTNSLSLVTSHVESSGVKGVSEFVGSIVEPSHSIPVDGQAVPNKISDGSRKERADWRRNNLPEQVQRETIVWHFLSWLMYTAMGIGVGIVVVAIYDWVRWNLTIEYMVSA
jgi:hypothetical protein